MPIPIRNYPRSKMIPGLPTAQQFYSTAEVAIILETNIGVVHEWIKSIIKKEHPKMDALFSFV